MNTITLDQQISISKARNNFSSLIKDVKKKKVYYIVKGYIPRAAIVDIEYLQELENEKRKRDIGEVMELSAREFEKLLRRKGYDPKTVTEEQINKLLFIDD